jgi:hypothetical protein
MPTITKWFRRLLERLRHCRDWLRCPACWRWASPKTFAKGRFLLGAEQLACEQCGETSVAAAWRLRPITNASEFDSLGERPASLYYGVMEQPRPAQELASLRDFLRRLESSELSLRRKGIDVTHEEVAVLKREIDHLEGILARAKSRDQNV